MAGVVVVVFFLFQGFGDPSRLVMGQRADAATQENIRKELYLDQPRWKQFLLYVNDVSPIAIHSKEEIRTKQLRGIFLGDEKTLAIKTPYLRRSYQTKKNVWDVLMEALPGTILLAFAAILIATLIGIPLGVLAAVKKKYVDGHIRNLCEHTRHIGTIIFYGYSNRLCFWISF